jgi:7-keto-8-aminopelargonate synthetase-like enzyme
MYALRKPVYTFAHGDPEDLARQLKAHLHPGQKPLVVSDGVFPTLGKIAPVDAYLPLVESYGGCLWLDDCHAFGVLGEHGRGTFEHFGLNSNRLYSGGTLSKAMGGHGGIITGTAEFISPIRAGHVANGANATAAPAAAAAAKGLELMMTHPELRRQLWNNARQLKSGLKALGFRQDETPVPVAAWTLATAEEMDHVHAELMNRGIAIQRSGYVGAGPKGVLRAVVFANHTPQQIARLLDELKSLV